VDTTLRDGQQAPGLAFSLDTRLKVARILDAAGIYQIEAGCPAMGHSEALAVEAVRREVSWAKVSAWCRLLPQDVRAALSTGVHIAHLCFPASPSQMALKLKTGFAGAAQALRECLDLARSGGAEVTVGLEDVSRAKTDYLRAVAELLLEENVARVRLSDTVGILTPGRSQMLVSFFRGYGFEVEFHAHNDLGLAAANSLRAYMAGAAYLDVTIGGVGERAGNCCLSALVSLLAYLPEASAVSAAPAAPEALSLARALEIETEAEPFLVRDEYLEELSRSPYADISSLGL
jgi:homocitrate synthase NifV